MNKFILKYLIIFVTLISVMFFSLVFVNKHNMQMAMQPPDMMPPMGDMRPMTLPPAKNPPFSIPLVFIVSVSSIFTYIILKYIDKNFVTPLINIETNVDKIKKGNLEVQFEADSENSNVQETFSALNEMANSLKEKEKLQDEFIRNLIHDLRAPIMAQERAMEILNDEMKDNPLIQAMVENNDTFLKFINSIIDAFSEKEIKIEKIDFKLSKLVDNVISAINPLISDKQIIIEKDIDKDFVIWSDYTSLHRIILNLVYNAVENIQFGKTVAIKAVQAKTNYIIIIQDNGQGMSDAQIKTIFAKHIVRSNKENKSISGIGLSVVHDLVIRNKGDINVESVENSYTKFTITLPTKQA